MKLRAHPESLVERIGLALGLVPIPLIDTHLAFTLARTVMAGTALGVFDALAETPLATGEIAARCRTDPAATELLLDALAASGYLTRSGERFALTRQSRTWLLEDSPHSLRAKLLFQAVEWQWLGHLENFVRSGAPLEFHAHMPEHERGLYHRAMRALAGLAGEEIGRRTPIPGGARLMIDLGGSHGHFAASLCRRHPQLHAEVLDLPDAIQHAAPLLAREGLGERVVHVAGDVTTADLGTARYDLVFMSNLAHHLDEGENLALARRAAQALRPGGFFVIQEPVRSTTQANQTASLLGLYFAMQSRAGVRTWAIEDMRRWQSEAGLSPRKLLRLRTAPGWIQQAAEHA
jgi:SAM-dependent methyltransferase